jgi:DNA helicase HerA-like ATPase
MQGNDIQLAGRRPAEAPAILGRIISVRGSRAGAGLAATSSQLADDSRVTVGRFLGLRAGRAFLIGVVTDIALQSPDPARDTNTAVAQIDLIGEIADRGMPTAQFRRGVTNYPAIGDAVTYIGENELKLIFQNYSSDVIAIGNVQQDSAIAAYVNVNDMLSKHFAVLGTTGVGKSSAVALILQQLLETRPELRTLVLDVHNEYGRCFGPRAQILSPNNVKLPFWLFNFEEIVDVFFGGRPGLEEEIDILAELIPLAKSSYGQPGSSAARLAIKSGENSIRYTVDIPVPYRIADLIALLDARMGKLENRSSRMIYHKLITRIEAACNDPRYAFMFENANVGGDTMAEVLSVLFRLPRDGVPMTIMQLAGFPSEVVDAVVSVTCRMAFDLGLWSDGADPLLIVCEEAHRYMAADHSIGFGPTRRAISRIAKEGRKYGVFLGLVTQRPAELDPTILSQCSTLFAMRMTNDRDQALLRSSVADTAANLLEFLPSLGTGEAFAFGEGVTLPTRIQFRQLPEHLLPKSETGCLEEPVGAPGMDPGSLAAVIERWRGMMRQRSVPKRPLDDVRAPGIQPAAQSAVPQAQPTQRLEPDRFKLLKRPLQEASHAEPALQRQTLDPLRR